MHRRITALAAASALLLTMTGCAAEPAEPEGPTRAELEAACLEVMAPQFENADYATDYCVDGVAMIFDDPDSETSERLLEALTAYIEEG